MRRKLSGRPDQGKRAAGTNARHCSLRNPPYLSTPMMPRRLLTLLLVLPLTLAAADRGLKIDRTRSFVDVDVKVTMGSFTGRLEHYDANVTVDDMGKPKGAIFAFRFDDLKTGKTDRDAAMIEWLGGGHPTGRFEVGVLALTPDGQGQVSGRLSFHGSAQLVEFPVNATLTDGTYTITGSTVIDYRQWGLKIIRKAGLIKVDPNVTIRFKLVGAPPGAETK